VSADLQTLLLDGFGKIPRSEFRRRADGAVEFRYFVADPESYPGFDGKWRVMDEVEQREHLRLGGRIAEWLRSLDDGQKGRKK
jgi:hypothetical protein